MKVKLVAAAAILVVLLGGAVAAAGALVQRHADKGRVSRPIATWTKKRKGVTLWTRTVPYNSLESGGEQPDEPKG